MKDYAYSTALILLHLEVQNHSKLLHKSIRILRFCINRRTISVMCGFYCLPFGIAEQCTYEETQPNPVAVV